MREIDEKWEDFVNRYLLANYETLEYWVAKRNVSLNGNFLNYIRFPKAENGSYASLGFIKYIVQAIESDDMMCAKIFGPAYTKGSAEIQNDYEDISIIWNKIPEDEFEHVDPNNVEEVQMVINLYSWSI